MRVSVVIPTYKRIELLERCLRALADQTLSDFEIIVADNAGECDTFRAVNNIAAKIGIHICYAWAASRCGPAHARNVGWRHANNELIAFTDDDTVPDPRWLSEGVKEFEGEASLAAASGRTVVPISVRPTDYELNESGLASAEFITANCFCRRDVLEAIGGFDERFTAAWREDSDLHFRLLENGFKVGRCKDAVVVHPVRPAAFGISLSQQQKAKADALLFKKHPKLFRRTVGFFAARYYMIMAALLAAAILLSIGYVAAATFFFVVWIFFSALFCFARLRRTSRSPVHIVEMVVTSLLIPPTAIFWRLYGAVKYRVLFY